MLYEAIYQPLDADTQNSEARKFMGKKIALQEGWRIEKGFYKGQHCYIPSANFGWIPQGDLKNLKNISYARWKELHDSFA